MLLTLLCLLLFSACRQPEKEYVQLSEQAGLFSPLSVSDFQLLLDDGTPNPEIRMPERQTIDVDGGAVRAPRRIASVTTAELVSDLLGNIKGSKLTNIVGTYKGEDIDGSPLTLSGRLLIPKSGRIRNLIVVSHYTIGSNDEAPTEAFPIEGMLATRGYAMVFPDYIGYGVSSYHIHPYLHAESTAKSVIDCTLAAQQYLSLIDRKPDSDELILVGYSQGAAATLAVMNMMENKYDSEFRIKKVYVGAGPYDLTATYDKVVADDKTGIPCAIPMIMQGINYGERLNLDMKDFFRQPLLDNYDEWINTKKYTVYQINQKIAATRLSAILTDEGRNKNSLQTERLYKALRRNSVLNFTPRAPIFMLHSTNDDTVPFVNAQLAEQHFKGCNIDLDFGKFGDHVDGFVRFVKRLRNDL